VDNAPESAADQASVRQDQAQQLAKPESSEASQRRSSKAGHLLSNVVGRQHDDQGRARMLTKVELGRFRRRIATKHLHFCGSARLHLGHLWAQRNRVDLQEVQPDFISRSRLNPVQQDKRMKRAPNGNDCSRALMLSRRRRSASSSSNSYRNNSYSSEGRGSNNNNNSNEVARPFQPITARDTDSRKVEPSDNQKKRHRRGRNNFSVTNTSGSGMRNRRSGFCLEGKL
jgi:hypothetical protein